MIELGNRKLIVHHTHGESPGAICLQDTHYNILFTGDIISPGGSLWVHLDESDFKAYFQSLKYLAGLLNKVHYLCPAHNEASISKNLLLSALDAFKQISTGSVKPKTIGDRHIYEFKEFSVLLSQNSLKNENGDDA